VRRVRRVVVECRRTYLARRHHVPRLVGELHQVVVVLVRKVVRNGDAVVLLEPHCEIAPRRRRRLLELVVYVAGCAARLAARRAPRSAGRGRAPDLLLEPNRVRVAGSLALVVLLLLAARAEADQALEAADAVAAIGELRVDLLSVGHGVAFVGIWYVLSR
jgi:hypothetical protein